MAPLLKILYRFCKVSLMDERVLYHQFLCTKENTDEIADICLKRWTFRTVTKEYYIVPDVSQTILMQNRNKPSSDERIIAETVVGPDIALPYCSESGRFRM